MGRCSTWAVTPRIPLNYLEYSLKQQISGNGVAMTARYCKKLVEQYANIWAKLNSLKANLANSNQEYVSTPHIDFLLWTLRRKTWTLWTPSCLFNKPIKPYRISWGLPATSLVSVCMGAALQSARMSRYCGADWHVAPEADLAAQIKMKESMLERGHFKVWSLPSSDHPSDGHMRSQQEPLLANLHQLSQVEIDVLHWVPKSKRQNRGHENSGSWWELRINKAAIQSATCYFGMAYQWLCAVATLLQWWPT